MKKQNEQAMAQAQMDMDEYVGTFVRANRCTVQATEEGYLAKFYRTHKLVGEIPVKLTTEDGKVAHSNEAREKARQFAIGQCPSYEIEWSPEYQEQAWERKYKKYATDEQAIEDATTLLDMALSGVAGKLGYGYVIPTGDIYPRQSTLSYIEDGKYAKDGCWAYADISMTVDFHDEKGNVIETCIDMQMVSGQIKKCKMNQTILKEILHLEEKVA